MLAADTRAVEVAATRALSPDPPRTWKEIVEPVSPFLAAVARRLEQQVATFDADIAPFARYALTNQGKQLRPALVALSAGTVGQPKDDLITAAVIVEMVHLATLVHDDVMDEAAIRRRRPTLAAKWGNQISVLLGDCLFAHALELAAGFPTPDVCRAVSAATKTVCSGEILQNHRQAPAQENRTRYFKVLAMKTAELFALSCDLGAGLSGGTAAERSALRNYGLALGTAYQVYDDCLDLFGSEAAVGKSLGTDLLNGKLTLPVLVALERAGSSDRNRIEALYAARTSGSFGELIALLHRHDALSESREVVHQFLDEARRALEILNASESRLALAGLAGFLAQQTNALGV